jgi:RNA recognition motif-containing protein
MNKKLYISGLTSKATDSSLQTLFSKAGTVESAEVVKDKDTGSVQGFGFVVMSSESEANQAIALLDGFIFQGRCLIVHAARPRIVRNLPLKTEDGLPSS